MTKEEIERLVEFILKQQESFADNLQHISYTLKDVSERQDRLQAQQDKFQSQLEQFQSQLGQFQSHLESLTQATLGMVTITGNLTKSIEQLAEAQRRTDAQVKDVAERLDVFINVVERYISESRNGKKEES